MKHRLTAKLQHQCEHQAGEQTAQKHDLADVEDLADVFDDRIVGRDHRHRGDDEKRGFDIIEFHLVDDRNSRRGRSACQGS